MSRVAQEGKSEQATSAFTVANDRVTSVIAVGKHGVERKGTMLEGLRTNEDRVEKVITLLAYGCPLQAIVHAFGLDERTVTAWQNRAGSHCKCIHEEIVQQGKVKSQHIQADAHTRKRKKNHCLDGIGDGCDNTLMACRSRK
jgi:hypothetical protein